MKKLIIASLLSLFLIISSSAQNPSAILEKNKKALLILKYDIPIGFAFYAGNKTAITSISNIGSYVSGQVQDYNGFHHSIEGFTSLDSENDLVLLQIKTDSNTYTEMIQRPVSVGQKVYLTDADSNGNPVLTEGILIDIKDFGTVRLYQIESQQTLKNSGFPVFDSLGYIIGMSVNIDYPQYNFAVPFEALISLTQNAGGLKSLDNLRIEFDKIKKRSISDQDKSKSLEEFLNQGAAKMDMKDYKGAIEKFNIAIRISPSDADAYVFRGQARYMLMEYKDALDDFSKAIELQPEFAEAYDLRGVCKAELGDKDGACADWYKSYLLGYNPAFKLLEKFCDLDKLKE